MNKQKAEDRLMLFFDKSKIKLPLFQVLMGNFNLIKRIILRNGENINFEDISGKLLYISTNIKKYDDLIISYKLEGKSTELFRIEKENLLETEKNLYNNLLNLLEKHLLRAKEIIFYNTNDLTKIEGNDIHILISDKSLHSLEYPAIYSESYSIKHFYINGEKIEENNWMRHPLVRQYRIKSILKKRSFNN